MHILMLDCWDNCRHFIHLFSQTLIPPEGFSHYWPDITAGSILNHNYVNVKYKNIFHSNWLHSRLYFALVFLCFGSPCVLMKTQNKCYLQKLFFFFKKFKFKLQHVNLTFFEIIPVLCYTFSVFLCLLIWNKTLYLICFSRFYDSGSINQLLAILGCLLHGVLGLFRLSGYSEKPNIGYVRITDIYFVLCKKYKLPHIRNKQQQIRVFQVLRDFPPNVPLFRQSKNPVSARSWW